jgi:thioredoxin-like negative regulator of GroEL
METLDAIVAEKPADEGRRLDVAACCASRGATADAEKVLKDGISRAPKSFRLRFVLADLYRDTRLTDQAIGVLKECLALDRDPASPEILQAKLLLARCTSRGRTSTGRTRTSTR